MRVYFDSGVIVKLYVKEHTSPRALDLFARSENPPMCQWQRFEVTNAIRLKQFRAEISERQQRLSLANLDADLGRSIWHQVSIDGESLFRRADSLSATHTTTLGTRTMDTIHVAAALLLGAKAFCTFDPRQELLARAAGLPILTDETR